MKKENAVIETMTVKEVCVSMRNLGITTSETKIREGLKQGVYPFGICIAMKENEFEIYKRKYDEWVNERVAV